jgi:hypothetical protein
VYFSRIHYRQYAIVGNTFVGAPIFLEGEYVMAEPPQFNDYC